MRDSEDEDEGEDEGEDEVEDEGGIRNEAEGAGFRVFDWRV